MILVYFIYGLSFFSLGLAILLRYDRRSVYKVARILWYLAGFAFLHGLKEWLDMWRLIQPLPVSLQVASPLVLLVSFLLLFEFGRQIFLESQRSATHVGRVRWLLGPWIYGPMLLIFVLLALYSDQPATDISIAARYLPGFWGAMLAAAGTYLYYRNCVSALESSQRGGRHDLSWQLAAMALAGYGVFAGLIAEPGTWFPASVLNTDRAWSVLGIPVQVLRALCALGVAVSVGHLLKVFQVEHEYMLRSEIVRRKAAMDLYGETRGFLDALLNVSDQCMVKLDPQGRVDFVNDRALQKFLCHREEMLGRSFYATFHHSQRDGSRRVADVWSERLASTSSAPLRVAQDCFWRKNGAWLAVSYLAIPVNTGNSANNCRGMLIVFEDLLE
jgi:PAS domain-containing protein